MLFFHCGVAADTRLKVVLLEQVFLSDLAVLWKPVDRLVWYTSPPSLFSYVLLFEANSNERSLVISLSALCCSAQFKLLENSLSCSPSMGLFSPILFDLLIHHCE